MAYEKQFWEQPHHDSSEEERLERMIAKLKKSNADLLEALEKLNRYLHGTVGMSKDDLHVLIGQMSISNRSCIGESKGTV
jgi:hypothetical protein